jgi:3'-5' exonuclease
MVYKNNPYLNERTVLVIDLETIPVDDPAVREEIARSIVMPGNISKPDTIAAWEETKRPALVEEAFARGGLSATTGKICCIGLSTPKSEMSFCGPDEEDVLRLAYEYIASIPDPITFVGHNLVGFDLPFLRQRSIVLGIKPPQTLRLAWSAKHWDTDRVSDTMLLWSADKQQRISLDRLCRLLGIKSSKADGMDGSKVWPMWQEGRLQEIADYCIADCLATLECYRRIVEVA